MSSPLVSKVLVVCTANICRSPAAEVMLKVKGGGKIQVQSAGTQALVGSHMDPEMAQRVRVAMGSAADGHIANHRARQVDETLARWAELILVMTREHHAWCLRTYPFLTGRVHFFATENQALAPAGGLANPKPLDVQDPYQLSRVVYDATFAQVKGAVERWVGRIF